MLANDQYLELGRTAGPGIDRPGLPITRAANPERVTCSLILIKRAYSGLAASGSDQSKLT